MAKNVLASVRASLSVLAGYLPIVWSRRCFPYMIMKDLVPPLGYADTETAESVIEIGLLACIRRGEFLDGKVS